MDPAKRFEDITIDWSLRSSPIAEGRDPVNEFKFNWKSMRPVKYPKVEGIIPLKRFLDKARDDNLVKYPMLEEKVPVKLLTDKLKEIRRLN